MSPIEITLQFMDAINRHDADALAALMTDDHVFVDFARQQGPGPRDDENRLAGIFRVLPGLLGHA